VADGRVSMGTWADHHPDAGGRVSSIDMYNNDVDAYGVAQARGWRYGFININDMYNNDVGKGGVLVYEAYEVK
jgi:hypothetical protein